MTPFLSAQVAEQDYEKEKLNERIAKLSGGVAVIQVLFMSTGVSSSSLGELFLLKSSS